jgi:hypothetical protein
MSFNFDNPYQLRQLVKLDREIRIPIHNEEEHAYMYLCKEMISPFIVFHMRRGNLEYRIFADIHKRQVKFIEESINTLNEDTLLWQFTNYDQLSIQEMTVLKVWFDNICVQFKNAFYSIKHNFYFHPFNSFGSMERLPKLVQKCTPDTQRYVHEFIHNLSVGYKEKLKKFVFLRSFRIWKEWYFNPNNTNGYVHKLNNYHILHCR